MGNSMIEERLTQEQLAKLPVWAQRHFAMIERALESSRAECETLRAALGEAPLDSGGLVTWSVSERDYALPDLAAVRFRIPGDNHLRVGYHKSSLAKKNHTLYLEASRALVLHPIAGNVVAVRVMAEW